MVPSSSPLIKVSMESCISLKASPEASGGESGDAGPIHWIILMVPPYLEAGVTVVVVTGGVVAVISGGLATVLVVTGAAEVVGTEEVVA